MKQMSPKIIIKNFGKAAKDYNQNAKLQKAVAWRLAKLCKKAEIPKGLWLDLGAGTGLLADALEGLNPTQKVLRIDGSNQMISINKKNSPSQVWDLNQGLPKLDEFPALLASSFALHWLENPQKKLAEWFYSLSSKGLLALAVPIQGSFHEWHQASKHAEVDCTALELPNPTLLLSDIPTNCILYRKILSFTQYSNEAVSLLKTIRKIGAQTSQKGSLSISDWRKLDSYWERSVQNKVSLTWRIQIVLLKR